MASTLYIKNMVCGRCIMVVREELTRQGFHPVHIDLGLVEIEEDSIDDEKQAVLSQKIKDLGFELLDTAKARLIERIKNIVISQIHHTDHLELKVNWSDLLSRQLHHEYSYLSSLFSNVEGTTLEQYIIRQKIEKAKELLFYDELNLNEISYKLGYSSAQHLSAQFKKITGQTPSSFKKSRDNIGSRKSLDAIL